MTFFLRNLKALAIASTIVALGGAAASRPMSISSAVLGSEWQCTHAAFVITTCALKAQRQAASTLETGSKMAVR